MGKNPKINETNHQSTLQSKAKTESIFAVARTLAEDGTDIGADDAPATHHTKECQGAHSSTATRKNSPCGQSSHNRRIAFSSDAEAFGDGVADMKDKRPKCAVHDCENKADVGGIIQGTKDVILDLCNYHRKQFRSV